MPTRDMKKRLVHALETLGVQIAGRYDDHLRWSVTDLATDLAPLLSVAQELETGEAGGHPSHRGVSAKGSTLSVYPHPPTQAP